MLPAIALMVVFAVARTGGRPRSASPTGARSSLPLHCTTSGNRTISLLRPDLGIFAASKRRAASPLQVAPPADSVGH